MKAKRKLEYTIKVYGEGKTEWMYFDQLRTRSRFKFSLTPEIPKDSRSSYKNLLPLIDKELKKKQEERANAIFLVIDTDTIVSDKKQHNEYKEVKRKYKGKVIFIESHPCFELWFIYHLVKHFSKTKHERYKDIEPKIKELLPNYEKKREYYQNNRDFQNLIINNLENRAKAIENAFKSCKQEIVEGEVANYTEVFKALHFFRLLKKHSELETLLSQQLKTNISLRHEISDHKEMQIKKEDDTPYCTFKYKNGTELICILHNNTTLSIDDTQELWTNEDTVKSLVESY